MNPPQSFPAIYILQLRKHPSSTRLKKAAFRASPEPSVLPERAVPWDPMQPHPLRFRLWANTFIRSGTDRRSIIGSMTSRKAALTCRAIFCCPG